MVWNCTSHSAERTRTQRDKKRNCGRRNAVTHEAENNRRGASTSKPCGALRARKNLVEMWRCADANEGDANVPLVDTFQYIHNIFFSNLVSLQIG